MEKRSSISSGEKKRFEFGFRSVSLLYTAQKAAVGSRATSHRARGISIMELHRCRSAALS